MHHHPFATREFVDHLAACMAGDKSRNCHGVHVACVTDDVILAPAGGVGCIDRQLDDVGIFIECELCCSLGWLKEDGLHVLRWKGIDGGDATHVVEVEINCFHTFLRL